MKKFFGLFCINLLLFAAVFLIIENFAYKSLFTSGFSLIPDYKKYEKLSDEFLVDNHLYVNYKKPEKGDPIYFANDGRSYVGQNYKRPSVLLLGDSYMYGLGLTKEESFGYQLSEYTKRPVFNWAFCTEGIEYSFLEFQNKKNIDHIMKNSVEKGSPVDFVICSYSYNQATRIISKNRQYRFHYLRKYGVLTDNFLKNFEFLYSVQVLKNKLFLNSLAKDDYEENVFNFVSAEIKAINNEVKKYFPNAKFILLIYSDSPEVIRNKNLVIRDVDIQVLNSKNWKLLEKDGIEVVRTEELLGRKMNENDIIENERTVTIHPNAAAWAQVIPPLVKKYGI